MLRRRAVAIAPDRRPQERPDSAELPTMRDR